MSLLLLALASATSFAGDPLPDRLAARATQPDVVLVPPAGAPSPPAGSFLVPAEGGAWDVGPAACSSALVFEPVPASEERQELWMLDGGVGARIGLPKFGLSIGTDTRSMAGMRYSVAEKLVVAGGLAELEACCLRSPETCTDRYISEYWVGTGAIHRLSESNGALKSSLKMLDKIGRIDFGAAKGWSVASTWDEPMYFAYRTSAFRPRSCESYMNDLPEQSGQALFTGVSRRLGSEQEARRDAQADARQQVVRYMGEHWKIEGDAAVSRAEGVVAAVKDALTCLDAPRDTPEGPSYLARVRMYVDEAALREAATGLSTATGQR
jgi:hypothetical protein